VPVDGSIPAYLSDRVEESAVWAEPDIAHAASWMRRLAEDGDLRARMGRNAAERYARHRAEADVGGFIDELRILFEESRTIPRLDSPDEESIDQTLTRQTRLARIQDLERQLEWITSRPAYQFVQKLKRLLKVGAL
jgi:hypothetical protein